MHIPVQGWTDMKKIKILRKNVNEKPMTEVIDFALQAYQEVVGGYIESIYLGDRIYLIVDEEGNLKKRPLNFVSTDGIYNIVGNCFFAGLKNGDFSSLTETQIKMLFNRFHKSEDSSVWFFERRA